MQEINILKEYIKEPIFNGSVCIYQANKSADKTIVLVHGLNGSALRDWQYQISSLAKQYHILTFDLPGFGNSDKEVAYYSPLLYAKFINYIVNRYAHGNIILIGHSMGSAISLRYSKMFPQKLDKLVLFDVAGVLYRMAYSRLLMKGWLKSKIRDDGSFLSFIDRMINKLMSKTESTISPISEFFNQHILKNKLLNISPSTTSAVTLAHEDLQDTFSALTIPILIIWGENDTIAPIRTAQVLKKYLPHAKLKIIKNAAHMPMIEQHIQVNKLLENFIKSNENNNDKKENIVNVQKEDKTLISKTCQNEVGKTYEGYYDSLNIINSSQIVISNANINNLVIRSSTVSIENSEVTSAETAMDVSQSDVLITASKLIGKTAIKTSGSKLDMAAVTLIGNQFSIIGNKNSDLVFSVSNIKSENDTRAIHEFIKVDSKHPL